MSKIDLPKSSLSDGRTQPEFFSVQIAQARRFHLRLPAAKSKHLGIISGGIEHCARDYQIQRKTFPYFGLEFVAGGAGTLKIKGKSCRLVPGTFFSYGPGIAHDISTDPQRPLVKYFVDFTGHAASKLMQAGKLTLGAAFQTSAPAELMPIFDELIRNGAKNTQQSPGICAALLEALLLKLGETRMPVGSVETAAFDTYQRCLHTLEQSALRIRTLQELAEDCHVDEAYLCRLFKRFDHESPYHRLMRLKMSHAAARMQSPGTLVKQVAAEMGFADQYHFSRAFKSVYGVSPKQLVRK